MFRLNSLKRVFSAIICILVLFCGTVRSMGLQVQVDEKDLSVTDGLPKEIRNIVILVCDPQDDNRYSPTGSMMIASVHSSTGDAYMTVLQPGLLADMPMAGRAPLSQAYALGGENLVMKTLNEQLGLNIREYLCIDLKRFSGLLEIVGKTELKLNESEAAALGMPAYERILLNPEQTLDFMRLPRIDPYEDRQYRVVMQALYQATRERDVLKLTELLQKALESIDTNIGFFDMTNLAMKVFGSKVRLETCLPASVDLISVEGPGLMYITDMDALRRDVHAFIYGSTGK